jgi:hypothetical protein
MSCASAWALVWKFLLRSHAHNENYNAVKERMNPGGELSRHSLLSQIVRACGFRHVLSMIVID